jgi:hypothetical protein
LLVQANELMATLQRLAGLLEKNPRALLMGKPQRSTWAGGRMSKRRV